MTSIIIDRIQGASASLAFKPPCRLATTANIALSGYQTIDGALPTSSQHPDLRRILVRNQTDPAENGIYIMDTGPWERAKDFDSGNDIRQGTSVYVYAGATQFGAYRVTSPVDPLTFVIDTTDITLTAEDASTFSTFDVLAPTTTRGDLIFRNATTNARLPAGAAGRFLQTQGASADPTWELVADASVATPGTPGDGINADKIKADLVSAYPDWTVRIISDRFKDRISARDFGANGAGNDYTTELNNFLDQVMPTGIPAWLPTGVYGISSTLTLTNIHQTVEDNPPIRRTGFVGDGPGSTIIRVVGDITGLRVLTAVGKAKHGNFMIMQDNEALRQGTGIMIDQTAGQIVENVVSHGFTTGGVNRDSFSNQFFACDFQYNTKGFVGDRVESFGAYPNDVQFVGSRFIHNYERAGEFNHPCVLNFRGGTVEQNGQNTSNHGGIYILGSPRNGSFGTNIDGVYFEGNAGSADVWIDNTGGDIGLHRIKGCTFNRASAARLVLNCVVVAKTSSAFLKCVISENAFNGFNDYVPDVNRKYWLAFDGGGGSAPVVSATDNLYGSATETPP